MVKQDKYCVVSIEYRGVPDEDRDKQIRKAARELKMDRCLRGTGYFFPKGIRDFEYAIPEAKLAEFLAHMKAAGKKHKFEVRKLSRIED